MLVKLEIVNAKVRATSRLGAAKRTSPEVLATRAAALLVRSRPPRPFSRRRVLETRPSARRRVRGRVVAVAAHARPRRHAVNVLLCGASGGISILVPRCLPLAGSFVNGARALVDDRLWPWHTARPSVAMWQEAAAALSSSSSALATGYLCK